MLKHPNRNLFFFSYLLLFCSQTFARDFQCDPDNRPMIEDCIGEAKEDTCAFFETNCPLDICAKKANNPCEACSDLSVLYYGKENCNSEDFLKTCYNDVCNPDSMPPEEFHVPVCGFKRDENGEPIQQAFENACKLCKGGDFSYFKQGSCPNDRVYCDPEDSNSPEEIESEDGPVCASFQAEDGTTASATVSSASDACSDPAVEFWVKGKCGFLEELLTYCLPNKRTEVCDRYLEPVCGFYYEDDLIRHKVMDNPCAACADPEIIYHVYNPCVFTCYPSPTFLETSHRGELYPVCGTYDGNNGEERKVSLTNPTVGCHPSGKPILSSEDGLCPGDKGIRCEDDAGGTLDLTPHVVCGYSTEDCDNDSCRQTYSEPIIACRNGKSIWYSPGACPGKEGIPCEDDLRGVLNLLTGNVCGFSKEGCSDSSCRTDYETYLDACVSSNIIYVKPGSCNTLT